MKREPELCARVAVEREDALHQARREQVTRLDGVVRAHRERALKRIKLGEFRRFTIGGSENKLVLITISQVILIVLVRRKSRAAERAALVRLLEKTGEQGLAQNVNFA